MKHTCNPFDGSLKCVACAQVHTPVFTPQITEDAMLVLNKGHAAELFKRDTEINRLQQAGDVLALLVLAPFPHDEEAVQAAARAWNAARWGTKPGGA